jgi:hypothetical protein
VVGGRGWNRRAKFKLHLTSLEKLHLASPNGKIYISPPRARPKKLHFVTPNRKSRISSGPTKKATSCRRAQPKKLHLASTNGKSYISPARSIEKAIYRLAQPKKLHLVWPDQISCILLPCSTQKATSCPAKKAASRRRTRPKIHMLKI